jgi:hypothetical protein
MRHCWLTVRLWAADHPFSSSLSLADLQVVLATIQVVDLAAEPEAISGIPSEAA